MINYQGIKGRYRPYDEDKEYLYIGRYTANFHHIGRRRFVVPMTASETR
jgi:hypothetical protein